MKTIIRNFLSVIRRFRMATLLNIAGLSVAFAAFIIILMQVSYERNFDRSYPTSERIYRVTLNTEGVFSFILPRAFVETVINSSPHIEAGTILCPYIGEVYFTTEGNNEKSGFLESVVPVHGDMPEVFGLEIVEGNRDCLREPGKVIIPESMAQKIFGGKDAVGKPLHAEEYIWTVERSDFTVGAVYKDIPSNSQLNNSVYVAIDSEYAKNNWGSSNYFCYLLLDSPESAATVAENFNTSFDFSKVRSEEAEKGIKLVPMTDLYYLNETPDGRILKGGDQMTANLLVFVAFLVILIAGINYTNFSTALAPMRIKSINTQKVLGSSEVMLRSALLAEAMAISLLSYLLSLGIICILNTTRLLSFISADMNLADHFPLLALTAGIALLLGLVAGLYPSWYMTSFQPAMVLKGSFGLSPGGQTLRKALMGFQFVISMILIIIAVFIQLQNKYMRDYSAGFDKDCLAVAKLNGELYLKHKDTYRDKLRGFPEIEDVGFAAEKLGGQDSYSTWTLDYKDQKISILGLFVSRNFLSVMGIGIAEGTDINTISQQDSSFFLIPNKYMQEAYDMEPGKLDFWGSKATIPAFTNDVKLTSLRTGSGNLTFLMGANQPLLYSYIRFNKGTDHKTVNNYVRQVMAVIDPAYPVEVEYYSDIYNNLYQKELAVSRMISYFSFLAILLSIVGVFGLVVFETGYRRKEIGIRKIMGATAAQLLVMFNRNYLYIVSACFILAVPIAYIGVVNWLEGFAYRVPIYWWIFLLAFVAVSLITIATVSFQSWRTANENPVNSIKTE